MKLLSKQKLLLLGIVATLLLSSGISAQQKDTLKTYYYMWTANHGTSTAWGENDLQLKKEPTEKDIKANLAMYFGDDYWALKYLKVEMILEFKTEKDYYKWKDGFQPATLARQIYIYRKKN